jgi:hypothetical protein
MTRSKPISAGLLGARKGQPITDLTADQARALWTYDGQTGHLLWRSRATRRHLVGSIAGHLNQKGYVVVGYGYRLWYAHRLAWLIETGSWPSGEVDHVDNDKANNRWANLRDVPKSLNLANVPARRTNTSGFKGVSWKKSNRRWSASIQKDGRQRHLGYFDKPEQAHAAYIAAANELFGDCARAA